MLFITPVFSWYDRTKCLPKKKSQSGLTGEQSTFETPCFPSPVHSQLCEVRMYLVEGLAKGRTFCAHNIISKLNSGTGCHHYLVFHRESRCGCNSSNVWTYCTLHDTRPCQPGPAINLNLIPCFHLCYTCSHTLSAKFPYTTLQGGTPSFMPYNQGKHGAFLHLLCLRRRVAINSCGA